VVIPAHNEAENLPALLREVVAALWGWMRFEIVVVDDASSDDSLQRLRTLREEIPELRVIEHRVQAGQSTALRNGVKAARAPWVVTLDGDGQNDPADIPRLLEARDAVSPQVRLIAGWRVCRQDSWAKRAASRIANWVRARLLRDNTPDTGCGIKLFERSVFLDLPYFDHMHRYLPALVQRAGYATQSVPVGHRARRAGRSNYTNLGRLWVALSDLAGVVWLLRRSRLPDAFELSVESLETAPLRRNDSPAAGRSGSLTGAKGA
jgi:dolichol-phosphate mannosyltransferase